MNINKTWFYFSDPKTFRFPYYARLKFVVRSGVYRERKTDREWKLLEYHYYGELVKTLVYNRDFSFPELINMFSSSKNRSNVFGSLNQLLSNHTDEFLMWLALQHEEDILEKNLDIFHMYF